MRRLKGLSPCLWPLSCRPSSVRPTSPQQGAQQSLNNTSPVIELDDQHYLINSTPWGDNYGLNWHLLTAIPANEEWRSSELILY